MAILLTPLPHITAQDAPSTRPDGKAPIEAKLISQVDTLGEVPFWVMLNDQADLTASRYIRNWNAKGQFVHSNLVAAAARAQPRLKSLLQRRGAPHRSFWGLNAILVTGDRRLIDEVAAQPEVKQVIADRVYTLSPAVSAVPRTNVNGVEWNIDRINAPVVWNNYGTRGEGIVVCNLDSGVQYDHPALINSYRGNVGGSFNHDYNWFDPNATHFPTPFDTYGHGTHTMGTIVGDGGPGNRIGVAPGAQWIAAKGCDGNTCSMESLLAAGQWVLAPTKIDGTDPDPSKRPNIVNNSWGGDMVLDTWFQAIVQQWIAAGIFPVFSVGNLGSVCWTAASPGDYPEAYSVGAFDISDHLGSFSSGGPTFFGGIKPDITAPGVEVRSAWVNGNYVVISGTSMAAPHVAGAVALLWSAAPALKGDVAATRALLDAAAINIADTRCGGSATNNNMWGHGKLDASILVSLAPRGPTGSLEGGVTNALTGEPLAGAQVTVIGPLNRTVSTDTNGMYLFTLLPEGVYDVQAAAFGYDTQLTNAFPIEMGIVSTQHFALQPTVTSFNVSGTVLDSSGAPLPGVLVTIAGATNPPAVTASDGVYSFTNIPSGTYQVRAEPNCCYDPASQELLLVDDRPGFDFILTQRSDAFGYSCQVLTPAYVEASTSIDLHGNDFYKQISLPFPFTFYGKSYTNAFVACNGFVSFVEDSATAWWNAEVPNAFAPNAAIYCFWDDLIVDTTNTVRTALMGASPNRQFVIEWRDVYLQNYPGLMDMEVILRESGQILMEYRDVSPSAPYRGAEATIGLENESGTIALPYSVNSPSLTSSNFAISFSMPASAFVQGHVTDLNDSQPVRGATIRVTQQGKSYDALCDDHGFYRTQIPLGIPQIEARANNYEPVSATPSLTQAGTTLVQDFALPTGRAQVNPGGLQFSVSAGQSKTVTLSITNTGSRELHWSLNPFSGYQVSAQAERARDPHADPNARTTRGMFEGGMTMDWPVLAGEVLKVWPATNMTIPWGVLFGTNIWLSEGGFSSTNRPDVFEFTPEGIATGNSRDTATNSAWVADMTYDSLHGLVCQVNVSGTNYTNCISCWNPATGVVVTNITGPWAAVSQRGIAYRPDNDTFYVGGWNTNYIFQIKGLSWDAPGEIIRLLWPPDPNVAGLAWNPVQKVLWEASNGFHDFLYAFDPGSGLLLASLEHPDPGYNGGGLECDAAGNLWMVSQNGQAAYLVNSGFDTFTNVPWVSFDTTNGVVAPGQEASFQVTVTATNFSPGVYAANVFLRTDGGRETLQNIPLTVSAVNGTALVTNNTFGPLKNDSNAWMGMEFTVSTNPISVTALGRLALPGNTASHILKLVRALDGQDVPGSEVSLDLAGGTLGQLKYATLSAPVVLEPNTSYYLVSAEQELGDKWGDASGTQVQIRDVVTAVNPVSKLMTEETWSIKNQEGHCFGPVGFKYLPPRVLSIVVSNEWADAQASATPPDLLGRGPGSGSFVRVYDDGTQAAVTAAQTSGPRVFREWQKDGALLSTSNSTVVKMNTNQELTSIYALPILDGLVATPTSVPTPDVTIEVAGDTNATWASDSTGSFSGELFAGGTFTVSPVLTNDSPLANGVTVSDVVIVRRWILGLETVTSPLAFLAGDVNGSGSWTVSDVSLMRRLILGLETGFPLGLWRFVPADYNFPIPEAPWSAPTNSSFAAIAGHHTNRFFALKLGDVNSSWAPFTMSFARKASLQSTSHPVDFKVGSAIAPVGRQVQVPIVVSGFSNISSVQFTVTWDPKALRYISVSNSRLPGVSGQNFGIFPSGALTFAWEQPTEAVTLPDGTCIYQIVFEVLASSSDPLVSFQATPTACEVATLAETLPFSAHSGNVKVLRHPPQLGAVRLQNGVPALSVSTEPGLVYYVEFCDSLAQGSWSILRMFPGDGTVVAVQDSGAMLGQRFYRLRVEAL